MPRIISCEGMDVSRDDPDLAKTVLTCEGDLRDPAFPSRLTQIICKLKRLVSDDNKKPFEVTKVEPWNSVRVTFNIPRNAAQRLRQLAQRGDNTLRELGILSVQIEGDQVITLTLTNSFNESHQQLLIGKSSETVVNNAVVVNSSSVNSIDSEITVNFNNVNNNYTASSAATAVSSGLDIIGSSSSGSSVEITRKNIAQYLSQQHLDVVNSTSFPICADTINDRLPTFRSPNVVAPINTEPIPFMNSSSTSTVASQLSLSTIASTIASTCTVSASAGNRLSGVQSMANSSIREPIQSNYSLFPFASMQHSYQAQAMHTKASHFPSIQRPNQVIPTPSVRLPLTLGQTQTSQSIPNSTGITSPAATVSSTITNKQHQPTTTRDANNVKVFQTLTSQTPTPQTQSAPTQSMALTAVAQVVSQSSNNPNSVSANVALTSPLLVNLLQSDATSGHMKGTTPQTSTLNQINTSNDLTQKRKARKSRKSKDKNELETTQPLVNTTLVTQTLTLSSAPTSMSTTQSTSPSLKHLPSNPLPQQSGMDSQLQSQSSFNISPHLISIPMSSMSRFPTIHPEAQGQPQVVRAGQLPIRAQLSRSQISAPKVGSPPIATTHLRKPLFVTTSQASSKPISADSTDSKPLNDQKSSPNPNSANNKAVTSSVEKTSDTNAVFPSPPLTRMTGKTKHLINPFTGLLEPMLSDEEEEDRPSPATLFPELDAGSDVGGNSERSLSDAGSNGKDNNHSSDTDSGLGKSGTDVSSQSSIDVGNGDERTKGIISKANESLSSSDSAIDRLKLKVKIEAKSECPTTSSNTPFHLRSHFTKQKSSEPSNTSLNTSVTIQPTDTNPSVMAEPRVPPLHISIRGPNSAVVVSNRRESTSDIEMKTSVSKKTRNVRTTRAMSVESGLGTECTNLNKNQRKKQQREQRFLSGGGIVTSNLTLCASPSPSSESLVDINQTLSDSSFTLNADHPSTHSSESVDTVFLQSSDVSSNSAQNQCFDNNNNNNNTNDSKNISTNKCVPHLNSDPKSSQLCAIQVTTDATDSSITTSVLSKEEPIVTTNSDSLSTKSTLPTVNSVSDISDDNQSIRSKEDLNCISEPSLVSTNERVESNVQTCHTNNEIMTSESNNLISSESIKSSPTDNHINVLINEKITEKSKSKSRKNPVSAVVTTNTDAIVNKISRIRRLNCIPTSIPALVTTRELNSTRNTNIQNSAELKPTSPHDYSNKDSEDIERNNSIDRLESTSVVTKISPNVPQVMDISLNNVVVCQLDNPIDISNKAESPQQIPKSDILLNGDISSESSESPTHLSDSNNSNFNSNSIIENKCDSNPNPIGHELSGSSTETIANDLLVKTDESKNETNVEISFEISCQTNKTDVTSDIEKQKSNETESEIPIVSQTLEIPNNTNTSNQTVSKITATSDDLVKTKSKSLESKESVDLNTKVIVSELIVSDNKVNACEEKADIVKTSSGTDSQNVINNEITTEKTKSLGVNSVADETTRQPLQIVITTAVPSLTTSTSTSVFSQLKSSSLESGSRVTLITFKPNLNSPNNSSAGNGKSSDLNSGSLTSSIPPKAVPFKLLTIPSGSGGITVRSAANKLVELINNSSASSPVSPLSPNHLQSSGSPINTTSPPVRLLVSKVATTGNITQTGVPVSVAGNSIGQLVVVKSVVVTNPSPSIKLVPAKNPSLNTPSLLIPVTRTNSPIDSLNAFNSINNNNEQKPKELSLSLIQKRINENVVKEEKSEDKNDSIKLENNSNDNGVTQLEPVDLTVQGLDSHCLPISDETIKVEGNDSNESNECVPQLIKSSVLSDSDLMSDGETEDNVLTHSVASDHNYNMRKSSDESEDPEMDDNSALNLSNTSDTLKDNEVLNDEIGFKSNDFQNEHQLEQQSHDSQSRPNKRKSSENAAELIKACMGVEDSPKRNSTFTYTSNSTTSSSVSVRNANFATSTRPTSLDNDSVSIAANDSSETNHLNKSKNLRLRKGKTSASEPAFTPDNCSSDEEIAIKGTSDISWANKPRLRTGTTPKSQKVNKQKNMNFINDTNKEKITNRSNDKTKRGRDRDQNNSCSTQRSTRRNRDHNLMLSTSGINLHTSQSSSEALHMEIVGIELSNDSTANNYNNDSSSASTTTSLITSSLLVKRKTRVGVGLNNNTDQSEGSLTKRRRLVKENHR